MRLWMHWGAVAFGVALGMGPGTSHAEEPQQVRRTVVLAQPLSGIAASVEHAVSEHVALAGMVRATVLVDQQGSSWESALLGLGAGVEPGVHFYFAGRAPEGFWVGPHLEASVLRTSSSSSRVYVSTPNGSFEQRVENPGSFELDYGGSARVGYTAILSPGFTAQVGVGLAALVREIGGQSSWRVSPRVSLGLGWAF